MKVTGFSQSKELPRRRTSSSIKSPTKNSAQRKNVLRDLDMLNKFRFKDDSVMIKIFNNGMIDGDVISLIVNVNIVFEKIKLTTNPLSYELMASCASQFQIECYSDNLGEIPPNTGLITISSASKTSEVLLSSDLKSRLSL